MAELRRIEAMMGDQEIGRCEDWDGAAEFASELLGPSVGRYLMAFWQSMAEMIVAVHLLAAARGGADAVAVVRWLKDPADPTPARVLSERGEDIPPQWMSAFEQYRGVTPGIPEAGRAELRKVILILLEARPTE